MTNEIQPPTDFASVMSLLDSLEHLEPERARRECKEYHRALSEQYNEKPTQASRVALELTELFYNQLNQPEKQNE